LEGMAQTRAQSRAGRSVFAFIMVLAGFSPTPAEEMPKEGFRDNEPPSEDPKAKPTPAESKPFAWDDERDSARKWLYALVDEYAQIGGEAGRDLQDKMKDDDARHALVRRMYNKPGLSYCTMDELKDFAKKVQRRIDEVTEAHRRDP
jgi:hypothetical protein